MQKLATIRGLCSTCNKARTCTFPRDPALPVWHCEEFDEETATLMKVRPPIAPQNIHYVRAVDVDEKQAPAVMGLCRNCDKRDGCTFPKPPGGVWHCEEYA